MQIVNHPHAESNSMPLSSGRESAESILAALEATIHERTLARVACGELTARHLAILELTRLVSMPRGDARTQRINALIAEFGKEDVKRWLSRITR
jgi:hypothetical protein